MNQHIEKYWCFALSVVTAFAFYYFIDKIDKVEDFIDKLLSVTLSLSGTLLGFLLTILTIINTITTRRMVFVRDSGYFKTLNRYLKIAMWVDILGILMSFVLPVILSSNADSELNVFYTIIVFTVSYILFANIRFSLIFIRLLTDPEKKQISDK